MSDTQTAGIDPALAAKLQEIIASGTPQDPEVVSAKVANLFDRNRGQVKHEKAIAIFNGNYIEVDAVDDKFSGDVVKPIYGTSKGYLYYTQKPKGPYDCRVRSGDNVTAIQFKSKPDSDLKKHHDQKGDYALFVGCGLIIDDDSGAGVWNDNPPVPPRGEI